MSKGTGDYSMVTPILKHYFDSMSNSDFNLASGYYPASDTYGFAYTRKVGTNDIVGHFGDADKNAKGKVYVYYK